MQFELSPELMDQILFAMENQDEDFLVDANTLLVLPVSHVDEVLYDDHSYYPLPDWQPADGFRTMEAFCAQLKNPVYRERLFEVLTSGRKVFRRFKEVLHEMPVLERQWKRFKSRAMSQVVLVWYNDLREFWGLEHLAQQPDLNDELVDSDFSTVAGGTVDARAAEEFLLQARRSIQQELENELDTVGAWRERVRHAAVCANTEPNQAVTLYSLAPGGDIVACIRFVLLLQHGCAELDILFVDPQFRGIGLAKTLLTRAVAMLREKETDCREVFFSLWGGGLSLSAVVEGIGAAKCGAEYTISLA